MIESMAELGATILKSKDLRSAMIKIIDTKTAKGEPTHLVKINFDLENTQLTVDVDEEIGVSSSEKYSSYSRAGGPNAAQWYATSSNSSYLLGEVVDELSKKLPQCELKDNLEYICKTFFFDFGEGVSVKKRHLLKLSLWEAMKDSDISNKIKANAAFKKTVNDQLGCTEKQQAIYTLCINGKPIALEQAYDELIENYFSRDEKKVAQKKEMELQCSLCGNEHAIEYVVDNIDFDFKYFITGQIIFASNMDKKNYNHNMVLCQTCYDQIRVAENFLEGHRSLRIADFSVYLVPHVIFGNLEETNVDEWYGKIKKSVNAAKAIENYDAYRAELDDLADESNVHYLINIIFYHSSQQKWKVQKFIKDVSPDFMRRMNRAKKQVDEWYKNYYKKDTISNFGLNSIYYHAPVKREDGNPVNYQHVLDLYGIFLSGGQVSRQRMIKDLCGCLRIKWYGQVGYNVSETEGGGEYIAFRIIEMVAYLLFIESYGMLERSQEMMMLDELAIPEGMKDYLQSMGYTEEMVCLFLLGVLVGKIGRAQNKASDGSGTYKPILNKLNFHGMDGAKVRRLSSEVFEKLRQVKILVYNEKLFAAHKELLDAGMGAGWTLNKDDNLFYLLSGYGYESLQWSGKKTGENTQEITEETK
ncbi:type I-B CRISPR-associated protein Cas8b/Csh1 [Eubacterium barkeri]|uniref:CRISPR-associated protein, Csh1 family n=1 Tax=Eubacterium barkeri TaxID=1528 RepID=A0A1H3GS00_EUBBA|nr:type I-B CRISPR-associated protein Cas8b/Csh1 [Eubacterium barkeri]SDY06112.1 CRISPR-associated protein, Csh1 family [Eubacterium barkeri]